MLPKISFDKKLWVQQKGREWQGMGHSTATDPGTKVQTGWSYRFVRLLREKILSMGKIHASLETVANVV